MNYELILMLQEQNAALTSAREELQDAREEIEQLKKELSKSEEIDKWLKKYNQMSEIAFSHSENLRVVKKINKELLDENERLKKERDEFAKGVALNILWAANRISKSHKMMKKEEAHELAEYFISKYKKTLPQ